MSLVAHAFCAKFTWEQIRGAHSIKHYPVGGEDNSVLKWAVPFTIVTNFIAAHGSLLSNQVAELDSASTFWHLPPTSLLHDFTFRI